jgi:hypothetical protein
MAKKSVTNRKASGQLIPGFNAEASIYVSLATYRSSGSSGGRLGSVRPAIGSIQNCFKICGGDPGCEQCCVCTRRGGHPNDCCF